jgi:hypothetical protein
MLHRGTGLAGLLLSTALLVLKLHVEKADAVVWITADGQGRKTAFDVDADHPALQAQGAEALLWAQTEYFVTREKQLREGGAGGVGAAAGRQRAPQRRMREPLR